MAGIEIGQWAAYSNRRRSCSPRASQLLYSLFLITAFTTFFAFILFGFLSSFFFAFAFDFFFVAIVLTHFLQKLPAGIFPHTLKRDALHDSDRRNLRPQFVPRLSAESTRLKIEDRFLLQLSNGRAVRTTDIVCKDLQSRNRIRARALIQDDVAVRLISVGFSALWRRRSMPLHNGTTLLPFNAPLVITNHWSYAAQDDFAEGIMTKC